MNPLLDHGQRVVSNRLSYKTSPIQRGDVVVFTAPSETRKTFIKRIIGLPGELIRIDKGKIFIEGKQLDDSYVPLEYLTTEDLKQLRIPLGHYFVVGDHRNVSNDSRLWTKQTGSFPFVPERYIKGKIIFRIWPPTQIGPVESISPEEMLPTAI